MNAADFAKVIDRPSGADTCDVCRAAGTPTRAVCDAPIRSGPWGYLCAECFAAIGVPGPGFLFSDHAEPQPRPCAQGCGRPATVYGGGPGAGDWAGYYCDECCKALGFQVWDRL